MLTALEQPVPPQPYAPPLEIAQKLSVFMKVNVDESPHYAWLVGVVPRVVRRAIRRLARRYQWSPGEDEQLLLITNDVVITDTHVHLLNYSSESPRHRALSIADIESLEFTAAPPPKPLRMMRHIPQPTVHLSLYSQPDTTYVTEMATVGHLLLEGLIRNAHGYPMVWTGASWSRQPELIRGAIIATQEGVRAVTLQRQLAEQFNLSAYEAQEFVSAIQDLVRKHSPATTRYAMYNGLRDGILTMVGAVASICILKMRFGVPVWGLIGVGLLFLLIGGYRIWTLVKRDAESTTNPEELINHCLAAFEEWASIKDARAEVPSFPGDEPINLNL
jgi:hypothetical protein